MVDKYYQKSKEKVPKSFWRRKIKEAKRRLETDIKISLKKKKKKKCQYYRDQIKNLSEEGKQKKVKYMRNYYSAHKKYFNKNSKIYFNI